STAQHSTIIPKLTEAQEENLVICLSVGATKGFSVLMTNTLPDLHLIGDSQCFPMFLYETMEGK
ncbi:MAG TPA: hypothetical protein DCO68_03150, partial [Methylophilaceae bacterium]|nr:hypothetical protein [Methylophilaceae bacterium]